MKNKYLPRISDAKLALALKAMGAVLIEGAKWCGKTSTAENIAKSVLYMQDPDTFDENMLKAKTKPSLLLEGKTPRLLDEWQVAPVLWNAVRFAVEVKMGAGDIETASENLMKFKANIDTERMQEPSFLMVLTATETAFQMANNVWVVPLGCLKN
ncbi:MAG: hypothetical protein FWH57_07840 [Oscillospiraceae bacterium]|nr:hypothetical protein [Oscillospiraceae bacterium]